MLGFLIVVKRIRESFSYTLKAGRAGRMYVRVCVCVCVLNIAYIHTCIVLSIYAYINNHEFTLVSLILL